MSGEFKEIDFGYLELQNIFTFEDVDSVKVGLLKIEGHENSSQGLTVQEIALFQEFGTATIPERSFMRSTMNENEKAIEKLIGKLVKEVVERKKDKKEALEELAIFIHTKILKKIESSIPPVTKKDGIMLIDTWQMYSAMDWEVG